MLAFRAAFVTFAALAAGAALVRAAADSPGEGAAAVPRPEARAMPEIWAEVVAQRNRILSAADAEIDEPDLAEMETAVLRLFDLMAEIRSSLDGFEDPHPIRIERAIRFVISRARDLEHAARLRIPGPVPRILPYLDEQIYVLQDRFPPGSLGDAALPPR